jgi:hypothetical protein
MRRTEATVFQAGQNDDPELWDSLAFERLKMDYF